jgi:hypothetical protein
MGSEVNEKIPHIPSPNVILGPRLDEDVLRHIATFLDFQSLRHFRLLSREWNAACLPVLMKRGTYNLTHSCHSNERVDLYKGAMDHSSWKISHSVYMSAELLHDNQMWQNVRSLTIHQLTPHTRRFYHWAWGAIQETRCPNLQELTLIFERNDDDFSEVDAEVESDYKQAIMGTPNPSFPKLFSQKSLVSVEFRGISDKRTAYFATILLEACTSLRRLSFCAIGQPANGDENVFRIFEYLQQNPTLMKNLQSFAFNIGSYSANEEEPFLETHIVRKCEFMKFLKENRSSLLPLQLSENLQSLYWDSPFYLNDQLLPGVLTETIASSLVQLSLNRQVENLEETTYETPYLIKISFPNFPRLRALKLGLLACKSLSVPELIDSAPNLYVLEMKALNYLFGIAMSGFWRKGCSEESVSNPKQHSQLRIFCTDIPFKGLSTLEEISSKFPNLQELRLGTVIDVPFDPFLSTVKSYHSKLQRLSWTFGAKFTMDELFHHLVRVPEQLPTLASYSLEQDSCSYSICCPISIQGFKESAKILISNLPLKSNVSCFAIDLLIPDFTCRHYNTEEGSVRDANCKQCYLHHFVRRHNLPIRIPSGREICEKEVKYYRDHCFTSFWIYK